MKVTVNATKKDYYYSALVKYQRSWLRWLSRFTGIFFLFVVFVGYMAQELDIKSIADFSMGIFLLFEEFTLIPLAAKWTYSRDMKAKRHPTTYTLSPQGIRIQSKYRDGIVQWGAFSNYYHNDKVICLNEIGTKGGFIAKTGFKSDTEWKDFIAYLGKHVPLKK